SRRESRFAEEFAARSWRFHSSGAARHRTVTLRAARALWSTLQDHDRLRREELERHPLARARLGAAEDRAAGAGGGRRRRVRRLAAPRARAPRPAADPHAARDRARPLAGV